MTMVRTETTTSNQSDELQSSRKSRLPTQIIIITTIIIIISSSSSIIVITHIHLSSPPLHQVHNGVDLVVSKAPNKGAVGLSLSFFDTSLGIISCHLASDSKGRSRLERRNREVCIAL